MAQHSPSAERRSPAEKSVVKKVKTLSSDRAEKEKGDGVKKMTRVVSRPKKRMGPINRQSVLIPLIIASSIEKSKKKTKMRPLYATAKSGLLKMGGKKGICGNSEGRIIKRKLRKRKGTRKRFRKKNFSLITAS